MAPVFLGGSDLGIAKNSPNQAQALAWVKLFTGTINQLNQGREEGFIPNATNLVSQGQACRLTSPPTSRPQR